MNPLRTVIYCSVVIGVSATHGQDSSIEQLIKKLPPPEEVARSTPQLDPSLRDPLAKDIVASVKAMNFGNALTSSQRLAAKYPNSAVAQCLHGNLALALHRFPEASSAFRKSISIQPKFTVAYLGLGIAEAWQNHLDTAMANYRHVTQVSPKAESAWIGLSSCAQKLGRLRDSVQYAKQATTVAPGSWIAWNRLATAEKAVGDNQAFSSAFNHANELRRKTATKTTVQKG